MTEEMIWGCYSVETAISDGDLARRVQRLVRFIEIGLQKYSEGKNTPPNYLLDWGHC